MGMTPSQSPQIVMLTQLFYPELTSTGQTMTELAEALAKQGVAVRVICGPPTLSDTPEKPPQRLSYNGIQIHRVWGTQFPKKRFWGKLINQLSFAIGVLYYLFSHRITTPILVNTNPPFLVWICAIYHRVSKTPFVYLVFDLYPETAVACQLLSRYNPIVHLWDFINRWTYHQARAIVSIGHCMTQRLRSSVPQSCHSKLVQTHIWADDTLLSQPTTTTFRSEWGLPHEFIVLYAGNMGRFHDMQTILDAAYLCQNTPDIAFVFVGDGHQRQTCQHFCDTHHLTNCHFFPYVDRSDLPTLMASANVGIVSLNANQWGLSVPSKTMGILAAGLPILAVMPSRCHVAKLITQHHCGVVIDNHDHTHLAHTITHLHHTPDTVYEMGKNAKHTMKSNYTLSDSASFFKQLFTPLSH
jgi:glycosyltransferase involved in cell wall biosynthesis